jgi:hypothetical protein
MEQVSKESVHYRAATGRQRCGNCVMFRLYPPDFESGACTLVKGLIEEDAVCDRWEAKMEKTSRQAAVELGLMRGSYFALLDRIELCKRIGSREDAVMGLSTQAWKIRREAYPLLVKLADEGADMREAAAGFGWSAEQLDSEHLRGWLCKE